VAPVTFAVGTRYEPVPVLFRTGVWYGRVSVIFATKARCEDELNMGAIIALQPVDFLFWDMFLVLLLFRCCKMWSKLWRQRLAFGDSPLVTYYAVIWYCPVVPCSLDPTFPTKSLLKDNETLIQLYGTKLKALFLVGYKRVSFALVFVSSYCLGNSITVSCRLLSSNFPLSKKSLRGKDIVQLRLCCSRIQRPNCVFYFISSTK